MQGLIKHYINHPSFKKIITHIKEETPFNISIPEGDFSSFLIAMIHASTTRPLIIVSANLYQAEKMMSALTPLIKGLRFYPHDEFITLDQISKKDTLKYERLNTLHHVLEGSSDAIVTHPVALSQFMMTKERLKKNIKRIKKNDEVNLSSLVELLVLYGYERVDKVETMGEFSQRGSILDIYQIQYEHPIRIDFFDNEIESIRVFNAMSQRSIKSLDKITIIPNKEIVLNDKGFEHLNHQLNQKIKALSLSEVDKERLEKDRLGMTLEGLDNYKHYLPVIGENHTFMDLFDEPIVIELNHRHIIQSLTMIQNDILAYKNDHQLYQKLNLSFISETPIKGLIFTLDTLSDLKESFQLKAKESFHYQQNMQLFYQDMIKAYNTQTVVIMSPNEKMLSNIEQGLEEKNIPSIFISSHEAPIENRINLMVEKETIAFDWLDARLLVLDEAHILKPKSVKKTRYKSLFKEATSIDSAKALKRGDYIVHYDHGIGRFLSIETMALKEFVNEYMVLAYKGDDKLYIPVENVYAIQKYDVHEGLAPKLSKLGGSEWQKTKQKATKKAREIAINLLRQYAERKSIKGFAFSEDTDLNTTFEADFPYQETPDQLTAIEDVKQDMESSHPMDRLICGDVGYGKTEIALRASFKAVMDSKQVAYLAPTTILSNQHYHTFLERFEAHGIKVELLNRFKSKKEVKGILEKLEKGTIDIILGTHRILSSDVKFKDLGLLIIDEEQRFGVTHKEKIQSFRNHIDVLTLTATPIPRTLQMALSGIKSMSVLNTPPENRHPIQTYIMKRSNTVIKEAIERELSRAGQVFYLYNRVESILTMQAQLEKIVPSARIGYAHGQMPKHDLEKVIQSFLDHQYDVLLSTTIIETGIDIPNANTLIVHDADMLGLSQLYQIRGRVGRSDRIAYSYMMVNPNKVLKEEALKRLNVIKDFTALGSGYKIAARDLAIRGAGDVLGAEQSGFINSVGMDMFMQMIRDEIELIESPKESKTLNQKAKLQVSKHIPETYIESEDDRFIMHKKIIDLTSSWDLIRLKEELVDVYGPLPKEVYEYMLSKVYEHLAKVHEIEKVWQTKLDTVVTLSVESSSKIKGDKLFETAENISSKIKLAYKNKQIIIHIPHIDIQKPLFEILIELLESLN